MAQAYTYHLYHTPTKQNYYGVRYAKGCTPSDLWKTYFSSSKKVSELIRVFGKDSFVATVRKIFDCPKKALLWEDNVLRRIGAVNRTDWLNQWRSGPSWVHDRRYERMSTETKQKISDKISAIMNQTENRKRSSDIMISLWENDFFRSINERRVGDLWKNEKFRQIQKSAMNKLWEGTEFRNQRTEQVKKQWANPDFQKICSEKSKKMCASPDYIRNMVFRGKQIIVSTPNGYYLSIAKCAESYSKSPKWVKNQLRAGNFSTVNADHPDLHKIIRHIIATTF